MATELRVALFLGAGASVPFGKPATQQLKNKLQKKYSYGDSDGITRAQFYLDSILNIAEFEDIEHVLQCIKEIDDFFNNTKYGSRYLLGGAHRWILQHPRRPWELNILIDEIKNIRKMVEDDVFENYSWNHSADRVSAEIYNHFIDVLKKVSPEIHIFTTNYDRAIEEYCSNQERRCRCIDGFKFDEYSGRRRWSGSFSYPVESGKTNVYLYKLHGSLDWKKHQVYGTVATGEERRSSDSNYTENLLIYPTVSPKDGQEVEPYKTIREEFRNFMESADICVVIGFSFRDEHITSIFSDFLKRGKKLLVISPSADRNIYDNLLKKSKPEPEGKIVHSKDGNIVCLYRENGKIITINQPLTQDNAKSIVEMIDGAIYAMASGRAKGNR